MKGIHTNISQKTLKAKSEYRDRIDLLRSRVNLLTGKDRLLMTMYLKNGNSFRQMARLVGVNEVSIARRIYKVTKRLIDGEYIMCLRNRNKFTSFEMAVAKDYFLTGIAIRKNAVKRRRSYYCVRETIKKIQRIVNVDT
jgi:predicted DNA-binding protein YlxM (UPF0122 family)